MTSDISLLALTIVIVLVFYFVQQRRAARIKQEVAERQETEREFLEQNKSKDGVVTTDSRLQYQVFAEGDGENYPSATSRVKVHYHGTLIDGTEFDSSVRRKEPISFGLNQVIPGWTEALQLMSVGSKARLFIPCELGYGMRSVGKIPAGSVLIFDVELLEIES
ncbi:FKBP-type peptidyl-prolyl cis-trans isomerase [Sansalvadorimonas sp. 2012CJ34-2]|uniref:Peptidyl-prolyl cis-trans isomerase n=1 Tax=Parendozoicomonas callyspongiae TaxID=2942213 RepID=A0ABT0PCH8_9GAMM|nr:FKBP-type peptidyl-prolyl cis-trans isomerase [Sansalvadorimonas sp. 2012CJ34-2]MCL6269087.1 FKBP-type peptidyl-prolyl cis-trans isomerase [Sansalvadorimonas sp. 2012CJ34-2]